MFKFLSLKEYWVRLFCCLAGVLCLWLHAVGVCHPYNSHHMCHYCRYLFLVECWELSLAMDIILLCCFYRLVCICILHILLSYEDKDVRLLPDKLLLWLHPDVLSWIGNTLRWALKLTFVHFISSIHLSYFDIHSVCMKVLLATWAPLYLWGESTEISNATKFLHLADRGC